MAHALRTWPNIMLLYTRTEGVTREMIVEAQRVVPRDVVIIPQSVKLLREPATQAAVLLELMEFKEPVKREGRYRLDLPDTKHHLVRRHALGHADGLALEPL
jgi:hypothetical protein